MDPARPRAAALCARGGRIEAVGEARDVLSSVSSSDVREIDGGGRLVTPGLIDAHTHLLGAARATRVLDLGAAETLEQALELIASAHRTLPPGAWLVGRNYAMLTWSRRPERSDLDRIAPGRAVYLRAKDSHSAWTSSTALALAGVRRETPDPDAGRIGRDAAGEPDGLLFESATALVARHLPEAPGGVAGDAALLAETIARAHATGVTGCHDFEGLDAWHAFDFLRARGELEARVWMGFPQGKLLDPEGPDLEASLDEALAKLADDRLRVGAIKCFLDGALGSRTAHLFEPYAGTEDRGMSTLTPGELDALGALARARGLSLCAHAIGDAATRMALDAFERWPHEARASLRPRIEHAQLVDPADFPRFARLGVAASMQPQHAASDRPVAEALLGERNARGGYAWRQLADAGAHLAFGSDVPVEPCDPRLGLWAAVTGGDAEAHASGRTPARALSLDAALFAYSAGAAWTARMEDAVGTLRAGSQADWVIWEDDLATLAVERLPEARVHATWVGGREVWRAV